MKNESIMKARRQNNAAQKIMLAGLSGAEYKIIMQFILI
jgi:hypothetical protein